MTLPAAARRISSQERAVSFGRASGKRPDPSACDRRTRRGRPVVGAGQAVPASPRLSWVSVLRRLFPSSSMFRLCRVLSMRPNSAMACASRVGLVPTCRVRMMPVAVCAEAIAEALSHKSLRLWHPLAWSAWEVVPVFRSFRPCHLRKERILLRLSFRGFAVPATQVLNVSISTPIKREICRSLRSELIMKCRSASRTIVALDSSRVIAGCAVLILTIFIVILIICLYYF